MLGGMGPSPFILAALALQWETNPFVGLCDDMRAAVEAAHERPAFASLASNPDRLRRFGPACSLNGEGEYRRLNCEWHVAPVTDDWEQLNAAIVQCFPRALRMAEREGAREARFRFDVIAIHTRNRHLGFRGGSYVSFSVMRLPVH
jgi:hypothetical protein